MPSNQPATATRTSAPRPPEARRTRPRAWIGFLALALLIVAGSWSLRKADATKPKDWLDDRLTYVPSGKFLKPMVLDYDEAVADLLWIQAMMYFADAYLTGKSYKWLGHMLDVVTTLNPHLHQAYEFAGSVLTKEKPELPKTLRILDRGIGRFPDDWRLRLYAAMAQISLDSNYTRASELLAPVASQEEVPAHIKTLCATLMHKGGNERLAMAFLVDRYLENDNPISRELFLKKMDKIFPAADTSAAAAGKRREVATKVLREAEIEPLAEHMAIEVLFEYYRGLPLSGKVAHLLKLIGE